jgi:hypothetical protein
MMRMSEGRVKRMRRRGSPLKNQCFVKEFLPVVISQLYSAAAVHLF